MAKASGWQRKVSTGRVGTQPLFTSDFDSASKANIPTIRLRDILDPKPESSKSPVRIRPPGPRPPMVMNVARSDPPPKVTAFASSEPPVKAIVRKRAQTLPLSKEKRKGPKSPQVRFVDSLGIELEDVKFFKIGENPLIPPHVFCRLLMSSELAFGKSLELSLPYFKPCFPEHMGAQPGFLQRLSSLKVCLEKVLCSEVGIVGNVQVLNLAFEKEVTVHYSFTNWRTSTVAKASWVSSVCQSKSDDPQSDIFRFHLPVPPFLLQPGAILEFAICYCVKDGVYWDNNGGQNYKMSCHSYKLSVPKECEDSMLHFT